MSVTPYIPRVDWPSLASGISLQFVSVWLNKKLPAVSENSHNSNLLRI